MSFREIASFAVVLVFALTGPAHAQDPNPPFRVSAIRAHPWYHDAGAFSDRDLFDRSLALRNAPIGESSLPLSSSIALVLVDVEGRFVGDRKESIELVAKTPTHAIAKQVLPLRTVFSESHPTVTLPFLLYDVGCEPVTITVRFPGSKTEPPPYEKTIPYQCGE